MMKTVSFCWPYTCFQGIYDNFIFILNSFENLFIHRIELKSLDQSKTSNYTILATTITVDFDLFILSKEDNVYYVSKIDLNKANKMERDKNEKDSNSPKR